MWVRLPFGGKKYWQDGSSARKAWEKISSLPTYFCKTLMLGIFQIDDATFPYPLGIFQASASRVSCLSSSRGFFCWTTTTDFASFASWLFLDTKHIRQERLSIIQKDGEVCWDWVRLVWELLAKIPLVLLWPRLLPWSRFQAIPCTCSVDRFFLLLSGTFLGVGYNSRCILLRGACSSTS